MSEPISHFADVVNTLRANEDLEGKIDAQRADLEEQKIILTGILEEFTVVGVSAKVTLQVGGLDMGQAATIHVSGKRSKSTPPQLY